MVRGILPIIVALGFVLTVIGCLADAFIRPKVAVKQKDGNFRFEEVPRW